MVTFACIRMSELALLKRQNTLKENEGSYSLQHIHPWCKLTTFIVTRNLLFFFPLSFLHLFVYIDIYTKLSLLLLFFFAVAVVLVLILMEVASSRFDRHVFFLFYANICTDNAPRSAGFLFFLPYNGTISLKKKEELNSDICIYIYI